MTGHNEPVPQEVWDELEAEEAKHGKLAEADEAPKKEARPPEHMRAFYARMTPQLGPKGVWGGGQVCQSMKALMLREQNVTGKAKEAREPFGRLTRKRTVDALVKEGKAVKVTPRNVRETAGVIHPTTVDSMLDSLTDEQKATPERVSMTIASYFGIRDPHVLARRALRAKRFMLDRPNARVPMHIREGAVLSTAIAVAVDRLFPEQQTPETREAVRILRETHNAPLPEAA